MKKCAARRCFPSTDRFTRCGWSVRRDEGKGGYSNGPADADIESWGTTQQKCHATGWGHNWGPTRIYRLGWSCVTTSEIKSVWGKLTKFTTFLCSYPSILQRLNYPDIFIAHIMLIHCILSTMTFLLSILVFDFLWKLFTWAKYFCIEHKIQVRQMQIFWLPYWRNSMINQNPKLEEEYQFFILFYDIIFILFRSACCERLTYI